MSTRTRLGIVALGLSLSAPVGALAQRRASPSPRDHDAAERAEPRRSSTRARERARQQNDARAEGARREERRGDDEDGEDAPRRSRGEPEAETARRATRPRDNAATRRPRRDESREEAERSAPEASRSAAAARPRAVRARDPLEERERAARLRLAAEREAAEQDGEERETAATTPGITGLASEGPRASSFVPRGWVLEQQAEGDLTGDRRPDLALVIRQQRPDDAEHDRALVVLERGTDGVYARLGVGTRFLLCSSCFGAVAGAVGRPLISIRRGTLHVDQLSGSRELRERALRFRLDAESGRMQVVGEELNTWDRVDRHGTRTSTNHLARTRIVERFATDTRRGRETRTTETQNAVDLGDPIALEDCE